MSTARRMLCILILLWTSIPCYLSAQESSLVDTLRLKAASTDSERVVVLNEISWKNIEQGSYDTALVYADNALQLASRKNIRSGLGKAYGNKGVVYLSKGNFPEALEALSLSLQVRKELGDLKGQANLYSNIGLVYYRQSSYLKALEHFMQALKMDQARKDSVGISQDYRDIGMVYRSQRAFEKALEYYQKALDIQKKQKDSINISITYNNISSVQSDAGHYSEALHNIDTAIKILLPNKDKYVLALAFYNQNAATALRDSGAYESAYTYLEKAKQGFEKVGDLHGLSNNHLLRGGMLFEEGYSVRAKPFLLKALNLAKQTGNQNVLLNTYLLLSKADSSLGNYKAALNYYQQFSFYKDSTVNEENIRALTSLQMNFDFSQKEDSARMANQKAMALKDATVSAQKKQKFWMGAGIGLLFIIGGMLVYQNRRQQRNNQSLSRLNTELDESAAQNQLLVKEMHHRIKNNLYVVCGLLDIQGHNAEEEETQKMLHSIRQRIECIATTHEQLYQSVPGRITADIYIRKFVCGLLELFGQTDKITASININPEIRLQTETCVPLAMLLSEWLTNTVKYAKSETEKIGVFINCSLAENGDAMIEYFDSGSQNSGNGLPEPLQSGGIGSKIIPLLTRQIQGKLETNDPDNPFHYRLIFPIK